MSQSQKREFLKACVIVLILVVSCTLIFRHIYEAQQSEIDEVSNNEELLQNGLPQELKDYAHLNRLIVEVNEENPVPNIHLREKMLDLIYTGNMADAWRFFYYCWPAENNGRRTLFLMEFVTLIKHRKFWPLIRKHNPHSLGEQYLEPKISRLLLQNKH